MSTHIRSAIRAACFSLGVTQKELAESMGLTQPAIAHLINRESRITTKTLNALCAALGKKDHATAINVLIEHLRDEIDRSGMMQSAVNIQPGNQPLATRKKDWIIDRISHAMDYNPDVYNLCGDLATVLDDIQTAKPAAQIAAEDQPTYRTGDPSTCPGYTPAGAPKKKPKKKNKEKN